MSCDCGLAGQHRRQQHAIIGKPRLVADHRDGVTAKRDFRQFIDQTGGGHSVADDDQGFAHGGGPLLYSAAWGRP